MPEIIILSRPLILCEVEVDTSRTPQQVFDAIGCEQYIDRVAVNVMPRGSPGRIRLGFFKPNLSDRGGEISDNDLIRAYEACNLVPNPYALALYNLVNPAFVDKHPNGCPFRDSHGAWYYLVFDCYNSKRYVSCRWGNDSWDQHWWFGGERK